MLIVGFGVLLGPAIDVLGVRRCLLLSAASTLVARAVLAGAASRGVAVFTFLGPASIAGALGSPVCGRG